MKIYRATRTGEIQAALIIAILALIAFYCGQKALGLWTGVNKGSTDLILFGLDWNTVVPATLLSLITLSSLALIWYQLVELLTRVEVNESGIRMSAPGYRIFYRWDEIKEVSVIANPLHDTEARLQIATVQSATLEVSGKGKDVAPGDVTAYLSEADRRVYKDMRLRDRVFRRRQISLIQARVTRPDGRKPNTLVRLLYRQTRQPDILMFYPVLSERETLLADIKGKLTRPKSDED